MGDGLLRVDTGLVEMACAPWNPIHRSYTLCTLSVSHWTHCIHPEKYFDKEFFLAMLIKCSAIFVMLIVFIFFKFPSTYLGMSVDDGQCLPICDGCLVIHSIAMHI